MSITVGLALFVIALLSTRAAMFYAASPTIPRRVHDVLGGEITTFLITIALAAGLILVGNAVIQGLWRTATLVDILLWAAVVALAVPAWTGLGRLRPRSEHDSGSATVLTMPENRPTPSTGRSAGRQPKKRAA